MKVGDAAQTTAAIGATVKPVKNLDVFATWRYYDNLYGTFSITNQYVIKDGVIPAARAEKGSLKAPSYNLTDLGASYTFSLNNGHRLIITGNVYNLFDTIYISDLRSSVKKTLSDFKTSTNTTEQAQALLNTYNANSANFYKGLDVTNNVYFGFGRTWAASVSYRF